jgi:hypothetical protein
MVSGNHYYSFIYLARIEYVAFERREKKTVAETRWVKGKSPGSSRSRSSASAYGIVCRLMSLNLFV